MWFGLFLVLIAIPLLELALLIKLGQSIGVLADARVHRHQRRRSD